MEYPFEEKLGDFDTVIRIFDENISEDDLVWHRDAEDRLLSVIGEPSSWKIQLENSLPQNIDGTFIIKGTFHRLLKGTGQLVLNIKKYVDI